MARLLYETPDRAFAVQAVAALEDAQIPSYQVGPEYGRLNVPVYDAPICIYIANDSDYALANEILIKLGAAVDQPPRLPPLWVVVGGAVLAVVLGLWVSSQWK